MIEVYRPVLSYMMDQPAALAWVLGVTFLLGFVPLGSRPVTLAILFLAMVLSALLARRLGLGRRASGEPAHGRSGRRPDDDAARRASSWRRSMREW